jgi:hypothetical protein
MEHALSVPKVQNDMGLVVNYATPGVGDSTELPYVAISQETSHLYANVGKNLA